MAKACPACGRPNSDRADRCLYCTAPLPPVAEATGSPEPEAGHEPEALAPEGEALDRHLLILLPGGEPDAAKIRALERLADLSAYDARMHLASRRPRLFRRLSSGELAREWSRSMSDAEIPHYAVAESEVVSVPFSRARRVEVLDRHVAFALEGAPVATSYDELLLLVRGEIQRERHHEQRLGTARGASQRVTPGLRLHLYARNAAVAVEIDPERLDWDVLGDARTSSTLLNLQRLLERLLERAPGAELDRGFDEEPAVLSRAGGGEDVTSVLASASAGKGAEGVVYDNEAQLRFYSRWRYRLARHLRERNSYTSG